MLVERKQVNGNSRMLRRGGQRKGAGGGGSSSSSSSGGADAYPGASADLRRLLLTVTSHDTKARMTATSELAKLLESRGSAEVLQQGLLGPVLDVLLDASKDNNFRVSCGALKGLVALLALPGCDSHALSPYASSISQTVVECLGDAKTQVSAVARPLLLLLSSPAKCGPEPVAKRLSSSGFAHRNWRVAEQSLHLCGEMIVQDSPPLNREEARATIGALVKAAPKCLDHRNAKVREAAVSAIATAFPHPAAGPAVVDALRRKNVRAAQISALLRKIGVRDVGGGADGELRAIHAAANGGVVAAAATAAAASAASAAGASGAAAAGGGGGGGGRKAYPKSTAKKKKRSRARPRANTDDTVGSEHSLGSSTGSYGGGFAGGSSAFVEGTNIPRVPLDGSRAVSVASSRALEAELARICDTLSTDDDGGREMDGRGGKRDKDGQAGWESRMDAMRRLDGLARGGAAEQFPSAFTAALAKRLRGPLEEQLSDLRSAITKAACAVVCTLSLRMPGRSFEPLAEALLPPLLRLCGTSIAVMRETAKTALVCIFRAAASASAGPGFLRSLPRLYQHARTSKNVTIRAYAASLLCEALRCWGGGLAESGHSSARALCGETCLAAVKSLLTDASAEVRESGRRCFFLLERRFGHASSRPRSLLESLDLSTQRAVER